MHRDAPSGLTFGSARGARFKLSGLVVEVLRSYAQRDGGSLEAGGILLGRYLLDSEDVVVDAATIPASSDHRRRRSFVRQPEGHQQAADETWKKHRGTRLYLGEWHTHPEAVPQASSVDQLNWKRLLATYGADPDPLYFVIVGTGSMNVWQGHKGSLHIELLTVVSEAR